MRISKIGCGFWVRCSTQHTRPLDRTITSRDVALAVKNTDSQNLRDGIDGAWRNPEFRSLRLHSRDPGHSSRRPLRRHRRYPLQHFPQGEAHAVRETRLRLVSDRSHNNWYAHSLCSCSDKVPALNGPQESTTTTIAEFKKLFLAPGFLVFASLVILASIGLAFFVAPKYGATNMFVYISICSLVGGISVSCTQGLGAAIVTSVRGENQFREWFSFFLLGFVVITLLVEINFLNSSSFDLCTVSMLTLGL